MGFSEPVAEGLDPFIDSQFEDTVPASLMEPVLIGLGGGASRFSLPGPQHPQFALPSPQCEPGRGENVAPLELGRPLFGLCMMFLSPKTVRRLKSGGFCHAEP
ncbi:hypothetical protein H8959_020048 [Pygathrix nigripes]